MVFRRLDEGFHSRDWGGSLGNNSLDVPIRFLSYFGYNFTSKTDFQVWSVLGCLGRVSTILYKNDPKAVPSLTLACTPQEAP